MTSDRADEALRDLVRQYNSLAGEANQFEVRRVDGVVAVMANPPPATNGRPSAALALSAQITLSYKVRRADVFLLDLCREVSVRTGVRITPLYRLSNLFVQHKVIKAASDRSAREVLIDFLSSLPGRWAYRVHRDDVGEGSTLLILAR